VGAHDGGHPPVEQPAQRDLLGRRLGVHVHEDVIDVAAELAQRGLDLRERRAARAQVEVPAQVHHAEAHAVALDHAGSVAGLDAQEVGRPQDPRLGVEIGVDLAPAVGVVAERDRVDAACEQRVGRFRGNPQPARDVLAVDDHKRWVVTLAQQRQTLQQRMPADAADEIADEQDAGLRLSHTLAMVGGR